MAHERTPFDSIEGSLEYIGLLREVIEKTKRTVDAECAKAKSAGMGRRNDALRLVQYKLEQLSRHIDGSHRILNDLRTLRRLLHGEPAERAPDPTKGSNHQLQGQGQPNG